MKAKAFDTRIFKRILKYTKPYKLRFNGVIVFAVFIVGFCRFTSLFIEANCDSYIKPKDNYGLLLYVTLMGIVLLLEVIFAIFLCVLGKLAGAGYCKRHSN